MAKKTNLIQMKVSTSEKERIFRNAELKGKSVSAYLLEKGLSNGMEEKIFLELKKINERFDKMRKEVKN